VAADEARARCSWLDDFLVLFNDISVVDKVLHAPMPTGDEFSLFFWCWRQQSWVLFSPLRYKVLLAIDNLPAHVWSPKIVQTIIDSFCLGFEITLASLNREDLSRFFVVTWSIHPN
jgi:hypothetical protein